MKDGEYYMDGSCFMRVISHEKVTNDRNHIRCEVVEFQHGLYYYDSLLCVEEACERRMVPSSQTEFETVKNLYQSCHAAIDKLNDLWFLPRWKEKQSTNEEDPIQR